MSNTVHANVWANATKARGAVLLTLLALADEANDAGEVDTTIGIVAAKARTTDRHVRRIVGQLDAMPGVTAMHAGGRIVARLTAFAAALVTPPTTTDNPSESDILSVADEMSGRIVRGGRNVRAAASVAVPPTRALSFHPLQVNHPTRGSFAEAQEPPEAHGAGAPNAAAAVVESGKAKRPRRPAKPKPGADPRVKVLVDALAEWQGYTACNWPAEAKAAKRIIDAGYTVDDARTVWREMKADPFWMNRHLSLASVFTQLGAKLGAPNGRKREVRIVEPMAAPPAVTP